ncbi:MAG TPA: hypothetical protein VF941_06280 [Clostridia bacterium]
MSIFRRQVSLMFFLFIFIAGCSSTGIKMPVNNNDSSPASSNKESETSSTTAGISVPAVKTTDTPVELVMDRDSNDNDKLLGIPMTFQTEEVEKSMQKLANQGILQLRNALKEAFDKDVSSDDKAFSEIHILDAKPVKIAKSSDNMLIVAKYRFHPYIGHPNTIAIVLLVKDGTYQCKYVDEGDLFHYEFYDIDSDGTDEIFVTREYNYKVIEHGLTVLKYKSNVFSPVFEGSFESSPYHSRYTSSFEYSVVPNTKNKILKDILFSINTIDQGKAPNRDNPDIDKTYPLKDTIKFTYDGNVYVPNKNVDGYINFKFENCKPPH